MTNRNMIGGPQTKATAVLDRNLHARFLEKAADHPHVSSPFFGRTIVRTIDGEMAFDAGRPLPLAKLRHIHQLIRRLRAVEDLDAARSASRFASA